MFFTSFCISRSSLSARVAFESLFGWSPLRFSSVVKWFGGPQWWKDDDWEWESGCVYIYIYKTYCGLPNHWNSGQIIYSVSWRDPYEPLQTPLVLQCLGRTIPKKSNMCIIYTWCMFVASLIPFHSTFGAITGENPCLNTGGLNIHDLRGRIKTNLVSAALKSATWWHTRLEGWRIWQQRVWTWWGTSLEPQQVNLWVTLVFFLKYAKHPFFGGQPFWTGAILMEDMTQVERVHLGMGTMPHCHMANLSKQKKVEVWKLKVLCYVTVSVLGPSNRAKWSFLGIPYNNVVILVVSPGGDCY